MYKAILVLLSALIKIGLSTKCDQTPPTTTNPIPSENKDIFSFSISIKGSKQKGCYLPDQTYALLLEAKNSTRPFRRFMITAEDPDVADSPEEITRSVDVGSLKTLDEDIKTRNSERCISSVENTDYSDKYKIELHWMSPRSDKAKRVRFRAMVAENEEVWYVGRGLTVVLRRDNRKPIDSPPQEPLSVCNLCSEARYEVIFTGVWSRGSHPRHYPDKPDENGYSHMIGASHAYDFTLWKHGVPAGPGLKLLAEFADISIIEREIIDNMTLPNGTRTLIRGKKHYHPYHMHKPSHSLFRVDRNYHLFSVAIAMKPSPDWFLGTSKFELCNKTDWLDYSKIPLYPWDAGTVDGISYESPKVMTMPVDNVKRVAVGSFDRDSPFYQLNLGDMKPFAYLEVKRLDVFPLTDCEKVEDNIENTETNFNDDDATCPDEEEQGDEAPMVSELRHNIVSNCELGQWSEWSPCLPLNGDCGVGTRTRFRKQNTEYNKYRDSEIQHENSCQNEGETSQIRECNVKC